MKTIDVVRNSIPSEGKFTADELGEELGFPIEYGFQNTCKKATRYLLQLCKEGVIVQWFISNGSKADTTDCCPMFTVYYMRIDSKIFADIMSRGVRKLVGHRII